jgi:hypothetical protein
MPVEIVWQREAFLTARQSGNNILLQRRFSASFITSNRSLARCNSFCEYPFSAPFRLSRKTSNATKAACSNRSAFEPSSTV